jgi:hypothetical protein
MTPRKIGGLNFSSSELTWMAVAAVMIVIFGYLMTTSLPTG